MRSRHASRARQAAARFYAEPKAKRAQRAHRFDSGVWKAVLHDLVEVFSSKCAYCEACW